MFQYVQCYIPVHVQLTSDNKVVNASPNQQKST